MQNFFRTLAPEQFDATVSIHAIGSYSYSYQGTLVFVPALIQASRAGFLEPDMDARLKDAAAQLRQEGFEKADYLGRGRYAVVLQRSRARGEPSYFPSREMPVFSIRPQPNGAIMIAGARPDATAPCQLTGTEAEIDGRLIVTLERGVTVLNHNAQSSLSTLDRFGGYHWRIKSPDADPFMTVLPSQMTPILVP
ncbi:hypothetical protein [Methylocystis sp.]|uniref:hypothetical protein n=1 Tax=Methylocystis sp. TaxID=1911079 RepID=UPI0025E130B9|nr:hypothetical protein [Methylocystis sp.]